MNSCLINQYNSSGLEHILVSCPPNLPAHFSQNQLGVAKLENSKMALLKCFCYDNNNNNNNNNNKTAANNDIILIFVRIFNFSHKFWLPCFLGGFLGDWLHSSVFAKVLVTDKLLGVSLVPGSW